MTFRHEPDHLAGATRHGTSVHTTVHKPVDNSARYASVEPEPRVDVYKPRLNIHIDTMFWQHRSIFAGTQEQLNELRRDADARAAARARAEYAHRQQRLRAETERRTLEAHRPMFKRLKPIVHVGFVPMLWTITTCQCGQRWPCNDIKQHFRRKLGWTIDITEHLNALTKRLPKPATRWTRLRQFLRRQR